MLNHDYITLLTAFLIIIFFLSALAILFMFITAVKAFIDKKTGKEIVDYDEFGLVANCKECPFIFATLDGELTENKCKGVLEIKTTSQYNDKQWEEGKIPEHYELQTQYYLMLTGYSEAHIVVLIGGSDYRESLVKENKELQALMLSAACNFWFNYVVPKKAPPLVDPDLETCKALYPTSNGNQITIADQAALIPTLLDLKVEIKELEKKEAELTAALQAIVGPNEIAITNDGQYVISWKEIERKG